MSSVEVGPRVAVVGGREQTHAFRRLRQELSRLTWIDGEDDAAESRLVLCTDVTLAEGAYSLTVRRGERGVEVEVCGGPFSGVIYAIEDLLGRCTRVGHDRTALGEGAVVATPGLPHRTFWTWDHSTNWYLEQLGLQEIGAMNAYSKPAEGFLADYRLLIDFMSRNRVAAVVIYGLLRDDHGGVESAQELCRYANERGVRIVAGVGINAYGGIYWEGDHPYNLATWLRRHPELAAQLKRPVGFEIEDYGHLAFPRTEYALAACPSRRENAVFHEEGIAWLVETLDLGGINFETGDYAVCECELCAKRRQADGSWSLADMAELYPRLFETARAGGDDLWLICEVYWDTILDLAAQEPLRGLPEEAIYQYCVNRSYWPRVDAELDRAHVEALPHRRNVLRTHMGTQWNRERYAYAAQDFARMCQLAGSAGLAGVTIFGEVSDYSVPNELNYLAFARFGYDPSLTWEEFFRDDVAPRLGGSEAARRYLELLTTAEAPESREPAALARLKAEARSGGTGVPDDVARRWLWLEERIARLQYLCRAFPDHASTAARMRRS